MCMPGRQRVIDDLDIWRAASLMVKRYKADAPIMAAQRADELLAEGDLGGVAVWKRILEAISDLTRMSLQRVSG
jgi:hypothetical protein